MLIIGQVPPPVHGSNVMAKELIACMDRIGVPALFVDKRLSRRNDEVGKFGFRKALRAIRLAFLMLATTLRHGPFQVCVYFTACSRGAFLVDAICISVLRAVGVDVVPYLHGIGYQDLAATGSFWRFLIMRILGKSRRVIVLGKAGGIDVGPWVGADRRVVIPNTVPDDVPDSAPPKSGSQCRLLYISTLLRSKGAMEFVSAARVVLADVPHAEFVVAGQSYDPVFDDELGAAAAAIGRDGSVEFLGPVYGPAKDRLLASCDIFVFPTRYKFENQPLVILEAMRAGIPVVSTRVGTIPEQVEHGVSGYLVEPGDVVDLESRMKELCLRPDMRRRMGAAGRQIFLERFSRTAFDRSWRQFLRGPERPANGPGTQQT